MEGSHEGSAPRRKRSGGDEVMTKYDSGEQVLVVPRDALADLIDGEGGPLCGFRAGGLDALKQCIGREGRFLPRAEVEDEPRFKQPIPYGVLFCGSEVFVMQRTRGGGDARLYDRVSLGVGGHVNPCDVVSNASGRGAIAAAPERALHRELREELEVPAEYRVSELGLLNDESNAVGRVHVGMVYAIEVQKPHVEVREKELLIGAFRRVDDVSRLAPQMETWSSILWRHLAAGGEGWPVPKPLAEAGPGSG